MVNIAGTLVDFTTPKVMGIVNVTKDSFYDGGKYLSEVSILTRVEHMLNEGVDIIDVGACSTRPGAEIVCFDDEILVLDLALTAIRSKYPSVVLSIDTFRSKVASHVVDKYGVQLINDISAGAMDDAMFNVIAELNVPYILMHMQGTPSTMQVDPIYQKNVVNEIATFFSSRIEKLRKLGVKDVILDPGFGFGKSLNDNFYLLNNLSDFKVFNLPLLVGVSRKSMIYNYLDVSPDEALTGTIALNTAALMNGASILRVHDVKEAAQTVKLITKLNNNQWDF